MTELKNATEIIIKYGVLPVLIVNVWWINTELQEVKEKMYECFDDKEVILKNKVTNNSSNVFYIKPRLDAVLPTKKQEEKREEVLC